MTPPTLTKTHRWPPELFAEIEALAKAEGRYVQHLLNDLLKLGLQHYEQTRPFYEIQPGDVQKRTIRCFGTTHSTGFMGGIQPRDVGKRVYQRGDILQVENDGQFEKRKGLES